MSVYRLPFTFTILEMILNFQGVCIFCYNKHSFPMQLNSEWCTYLYTYSTRNNLERICMFYVQCSCHSCCKKEFTIKVYPQSKTLSRDRIIWLYYVKCDCRAKVSQLLWRDAYKYTYKYFDAVRMCTDKIFTSFKNVPPLHMHIFFINFLFLVTYTIIIFLVHVLNWYPQSITKLKVFFLFCRSDNIVNFCSLFLINSHISAMNNKN